MISEIIIAAESVGIKPIVTNSKEKIETQLNRLTGIEELPAMLISWDYETLITFDSNGFIKPPSTNIVALLMTKAEGREKVEMELASGEMGTLFIEFVKVLNSNLKTIIRMNEDENPVTGISMLNTPSHGAGKHSGVLGKFNILSKVNNC